jgi:hypothetical protein
MCGGAKVTCGKTKHVNHQVPCDFCATLYDVLVIIFKRPNFLQIILCSVRSANRIFSYCLKELSPLEQSNKTQSIK